MWAARNGHEDVVDVLILNNATVNEKTSEGRTALIEASANGHIEET